MSEPNLEHIAAPLRGLAVPVDSLVPDQANARKHGKANMAAIEASLRRFGQRLPIVVQEEGMVVRAGNGRLAAAKALGWTHLAAVVVDEDSVDATAFAIADNRSGELAEWDDDALARTLHELGVETSAELGFDGADYQKLLDGAGLGEPVNEQDGEVVEPPENPVACPGDLWQLGNHWVKCGDATSKADVDDLLDGATPNLMVTDPPYGVNYTPAWRIEAGVNDAEGKTARDAIANDDRADWSAAVALFPGHVAYLWHAGLAAIESLGSLASCGFEVRAQLLWVKPRGIFSRSHYHWAHEPCWYAVRRGAAADWSGDRRQSTVWEVPVTKDGDATGHAPQKPLECMARPMRNHGGDEVYDPFLGSGSTLIAAENNGRACFGMELNPAYVDVIIRRWQDRTGGEALLGERTFEEVRRERQRGE